jgi:hypothetical protein
VLMDLGNILHCCSLSRSALVLLSTALSTVAYTYTKTVLSAAVCCHFIEMQATSY